MLFLLLLVGAPGGSLARIIPPLSRIIPPGLFGPPAKLLLELFFPPPADAPGMPYGPGFPGGGFPTQPPPQSLYPPKSIPSPPPPGPVALDNGIYRISNLVATYRRVQAHNHSVIIREDARYLNSVGALIGGPIGEVTVFEASHGANGTTFAFVFRDTRRAPGSDILRIRLDSEFADFGSAHHIFKGFTYDLQLVTPGSNSPPPTAAPPPYSFIPPSKPLGSPGGNPPTKPGPGPLSPPPQEEKKRNPPLPGRGPLKNPPNSKPKNPPSTAPGSPPAAPPAKPPAAPPANPPKKEEKPKTPELPKNPSPIGTPFLAPIIREYATNDPVLKSRNQPNTGPSAKPETGLGLSNPFTPPSALAPSVPQTSPIPGAPQTAPIPGAPQTSPVPGTNPRPGEQKRKPPILPPLPIGNAQDPQIKPADEKKQPVVQTPGGGGCCTPPGIGQANQSLDGIKLLLEGIDLSLLQVINTKLGPQVPGGLSGYLLDRFTKLWKSRTVDRALSLMATAASIHNAVMLSRNIGSTLISTLGNALSIIGIKDGDEVAQSFSTVIGDGIENIIKGLIGTQNYTTLSETWAKANRIYQSAINIYQLMTDSLFGITSGLEQTAKYTGRIGNALRKSGVVLENSYNWMTDQFNFSSGKNRKIDRVIQGLQGANEIASDLESITSEFRSVTENVAEIGTQVNVIKGEINGKEDEKKNQEDQGKQSSQAPTINKSDLIKPN